MSIVREYRELVDRAERIEGWLEAARSQGNQVSVTLYQQDLAALQTKIEAARERMKIRDNLAPLRAQVAADPSRLPTLLKALEDGGLNAELAMLLESEIERLQALPKKERRRFKKEIADLVARFHVATDAARR